MKKHHLSIDDETMQVLRASDITHNSVKLPMGKLARPLYAKVNKVLELAGGKWSRSSKSHAFTEDPREKLGMAVQSGAIKDEKKASQAFHTPAELARHVALYASVERCTVLEPSAGHGALAIACEEAGAEMVICIEQDPASARKLQERGFSTIVRDFLMVTPTPYDRVVMNPPFTSGQDVDHVTHAFQFVKPGGRLVSIMSPGWETKQDKRSAAFRDLLKRHGQIAERVDAGAFKESGTNVATVVVILDKN